jgi:CHAP domain
MPTEKKQYEIPLTLTTPHMHGQKVKDAQWLMAGHNKISGLATYKDGAVDGDYGTLTAQATFRTKYWLGYPEKEINRSFGQTVYELLNGTLKLNEDNLRRRKQRLEAQTVETVGQKALATAIPEIGNHESPSGSNMNKYGSWYGMNGVPWCAIFVSWCFGHSGNTRFRYSYVPAVHNDARYCRNHLCVVRSPKPGDLACFNFGNYDGHIEFFEKWLTSNTFLSVGGNTGSASYNNGGEVLRSTRYTSNVDAFVRVT